MAGLFILNPIGDLRLFTKIPRGSERWKLKMNERTAAERVNYGIENTKTRGKKRISFAITSAAFNVHLDAQLKKLKSSNLFDFQSVFGVLAAT